MSHAHQRPALDRIAAFLKADPSRALIVAPPGTGKGNLLADAARMNEGRSLVLAHRSELVDQLAARVRTFAPEMTVGVEMGGGKADPLADVIVASVQTVGRVGSTRLAELDFSLVLTDEAHRAAASSYRRTVERLAPGAHHLGFTATPTAAGSVPLMGHKASPFDSILWDYPILQAVEDGALCDLRGWVVRSHEKLDRVRITGGDFDACELAEAVDTELRTAACFKAWLDLAPDRRTLAFCASVDHARNVAAFFASQGVAAAAVWGDMADRDREEALRRFRDGRTRVLANCALLTEGIDIPAVDAILMMRPTRSRTLFVQSVGRGMRLHPGKRDCVVIDVVDVTRRHDLVTLSAVAGLPPKTDLCGETFLNAFRESERLDLPENLRTGEMTLDELRMRATEVRILVGHGSSRPSTTFSANVRKCEGCGKEIRDYPYGPNPSRKCSTCSRRTVSMVGQIYNRLTVLSACKSRSGKAYVLCLCACGATKEINAFNVRNGSVKSCGCALSDSQHARMVDLTDRRFGKLRVVGLRSRDAKSPLWDCVCDCGGSRVVSSNLLTMNRAKSCGCMNPIKPAS